MCDAEKAMLIGNFIALNEYIRKEKISKTSHPNFHIRKPENVDQIKFQVTRKKKIIETRVYNKWNITFKNWESLFCTSDTYIILYINYTSI